VLDWSWSVNGDAYAPVPAWLLSQRPTRYATAVNARIVKWGLQGSSIVIVLATLWCVRVGLRGREEAVGRWLAARGRNLTKPYRCTAFFVFSVSVFTAILFLRRAVISISLRPLWQLFVISVELQAPWSGLVAFRTTSTILKAVNTFYLSEFRGCWPCS
jgi:hypothetical protein